MKAVEMAVAKVVAVMVEEEMAAVMGEAVMVVVVMVGDWVEVDRVEVKAVAAAAVEREVVV